MWCTWRAWSKLQSTMTSSSQWPVCYESAGRPTGWLVNAGLFTAFSHELSQIVLRHYTRNVINIIVCAITNNWMANNAWKLHIWYNFEIVQWNRTELKKTCISDRALAGRDTSRVAIQSEDGIVALAECHFQWLFPKVLNRENANLVIWLEIIR